MLSVDQGIVPPCINIEELDSRLAQEVNIVQGKQVVDQGSQSRILLKNSFGFGGTNVSLVFAK